MTSQRSSPFRRLVPVTTVAAGFALAAAAWTAAGPAAPGGRWFAVHLFTLGTLSTLVLGFTQHFADTLTRTAGRWPRGPLVVYLAGVAAVLGGRLQGRPWLLASGAAVATAGVLASRLRLRRARQAAVGARFAWIVRLYERAHGAFVHGAVLGGLLGTGVLAGRWHLAGRLAHLHVNVLGWAGLTVLGTLVFFGPTMLRTRIEEGADERAARVLRRGATALTVGVLALLAAGVGGGLGVGLRLIAAGSLAVLAGAAGIVLAPVIRACLEPTRATVRFPLLAACVWLLTSAGVDVAVVAAGAWWLLDAVGLAALAGGLLQLILAVLLHLAPGLRGARTGRIVRRRLRRAGAPLTVVLNLGVVAAVGGALLHAAGTDGGVLAVPGWAGVAAGVGWAATLVAVPARSR